MGLEDLIGCLVVGFVLGLTIAVGFHFIAKEFLSRSTSDYNE